MTPVEQAVRRMATPEWLATAERVYEIIQKGRRDGVADDDLHEAVTGIRLADLETIAEEDNWHEAKGATVKVADVLVALGLVEKLPPARCCDMEMYRKVSR